tara:strand:+ start:502 stop:999 length:498 start_codon:yes stop_codon:yes gene_type:complete
VFKYLLFGLLFPLKGNGLESDQRKPIRIQADTAVITDKAGLSFYEGDVLIVQGTLQIKADTVEIKSQDKNVQKIIARSGMGSKKLAKFKQILKTGGGEIFAEARQISYLVQEGRLLLNGQAKLEQSKDVFSGEMLFYDIGKGIVNLESGSSKERVNMTISPKESP